MRRFDAIWAFKSGVYTDVTQTLGDGSTPLALGVGDKIYLLHPEAVSGFYFEPTTYTTPLTYVVEHWFDGAWRVLPQEEFYTQTTDGFTITPQIPLTETSVVLWRKSPWPQLKATPTNTFPEAVAPPDTTERHFYRLRITAGTVTLGRVLPRLFNTYASASEVASFIGIPEFDDDHSPTNEMVRDEIAKAEDNLDKNTLKSWRLSAVYHENYDFNPAGFLLKRRPVRLVSSLVVWNGNTFDTFLQGRGKDWFLDPRMSQVVYTIPSFRLRQYSYVLQRAVRQAGSVVVNYVYGRDFDTDELSYMVKGVILRRVAVTLITQADWTGILTSGGGTLDTIPKPEKVRQWAEEAQQATDELRGLVTV